MVRPCIGKPECCSYTVIKMIFGVSSTLLMFWNFRYLSIFNIVVVSQAHWRFFYLCRVVRWSWVNFQCRGVLHFG